MIVEVVSVASYVLWMELYFVPVFVVLVNGSSVYCALSMYIFDNVVAFV